MVTTSPELRRSLHGNSTSQNCDSSYSDDSISQALADAISSPFKPSPQASIPLQLQHHSDTHTRLFQELDNNTSGTGDTANPYQSPEERNNSDTDPDTTPIDRRHPTHRPSNRRSLPRRISRFGLALVHRPSFLFVVITLSASMLTMMYSMRSYIVEPSQAVPEFIPQAAIITVPGTNITLAARPAAFGPIFPTRKDEQMEYIRDTAAITVPQQNVDDDTYQEPTPTPVTRTPIRVKRSWSKNTMFRSLFGNGGDDEAQTSASGLQKPISPERGDYRPGERADNHRDRIGSSMSPFDDVDLQEEADEEEEEKDEEKQMINYFLHLNGHNFSKVESERGFVGTLAVVPGSACSPVIGYQDLRGKIALVMRGDCSFYQKVLVLQQWGASAVIVGDNMYRRGLITMYSTADPDMAQIPSVFVSRASYDMLKIDLGSGTTIVINTVDTSGPIIGPVLFLLVSPLCSLTIIYGILLFHRRYKRVKERAPKWVVDNLPRRIWVNPYGAPPLAQNGESSAVMAAESEPPTTIAREPESSATMAAESESSAALEPATVLGLLESSATTGEASRSTLTSLDDDESNSITNAYEDDNNVDENSRLISQVPEDDNNNFMGNRGVAAAASSHGTIEDSLAMQQEQSPLLLETTTNPAAIRGGTNTDSECTVNTCNAPEKIWVSSGECIICLEDYVSGESLVLRLPCGHEFHEDCIRKWLLRRKRTCPICKMDVTAVVSEQQRKARGWLAWAWARTWEQARECVSALMIFRRDEEARGRAFDDEEDDDSTDSDV